MAGIPIITGFDLSAPSALDRRTVVADTTARLALVWVYKGLLVYQVDTNTFYKYTGTPPANTAPDWTVVLSTGAAGAPGSVWYDGSGVPSGGLGINGDYYLENTSGDVYKKVTGTWGIVANIKGPVGASGTSAGDFATLVVTGGATAQALTTSYAKVTQFVTNGPYSGSVPNATNNLITVTNPGDYLFWLNADVLGIVNRTYTLVLYVNGVISNIIGTFDCTSNPTPNVSFQLPINIATTSSVVELYAKSSGSFNLTFITGSWGCAGLNAKGATGNAGKALIHTEADITLNDAKVTAVQAGSWTSILPWSASVASDARSSYSTPIGITGSKLGHSISYNGANWSDNGVWRGPTGSAGSTGATGATGPAGAAGLIPFSQAPSPTMQNLTLGWYFYDQLTALPVIFGGNNALGTTVTVCRTVGGTDVSIPADSTFASATITTNANATLNHKGRYVSSIPFSTRNITFQVVATLAGVDHWKVIGEDQYIDPASYLPTTRANFQFSNAVINTTSFEIGSNGVGGGSYTYTGATYVPYILQGRQFKPLIITEVSLYADSGPGTSFIATLELLRSVDFGAFTTIKTRSVNIYVSTGASFHVRDFIMHHADTGLPSSYTSIDYSLKVTKTTASGRLFRMGSILDITVSPIFAGD
jgi:hypothetical protein